MTNYKKEKRKKKKIKVTVYNLKNKKQKPLHQKLLKTIELIHGVAFVVKYFGKTILQHSSSVQFAKKNIKLTFSLNGGK